MFRILCSGSTWAFVFYFLFPFSRFLSKGLNAIMFHGGASEGDRTMLDVLLPVARVLCKGQLRGTPRLWHTEEC